MQAVRLCSFWGGARGRLYDWQHNADDNALFCILMHP